MSESEEPILASQPSLSNLTSRRKTSWPFTFSLAALVPVVAATILYQLDSFDPAPFPPHELSRHVLAVPASNNRMLEGSELVGVGDLKGPEDIAYEPESGVIYTGCSDGWINRVKVNESVSNISVEKWINTGGRPLGIVLGRNNEVVVADAEKGLLNVTGEGMVELLAIEADGQKFKLTDCLDVALNGMIYFTDASYKYSLSEFPLDLLEGKPHGRLMSYDPETRRTEVLVHNLYFANGVAVSPDQNSVIFCESHMRRCRRYHIQGKDKGRVDKFIDYLPGWPDNIRYDGEGQYWIALYTGTTLAWDLAARYPFIRKVVAIMERFGLRPAIEKNAGVLAVDLAGKPTAYFHDPKLSKVTSGIKIGDYLYCGSLYAPYIIRLNLNKHPARATT